MRCLNLTESFLSAGHEVEIWTAAFNHAKKNQRSLGFERILVSEDLIVNLVPSCGYTSNISLRRIIDHMHLAWNMRRELNKLGDQKLPDICIIGCPPIEFAFVTFLFLRPHRTYTVLDVKDLWPDVLVNACPFPKMAKFFLLHYSLMMKLMVRGVDLLVGITPEFTSYLAKRYRRSPDRMSSHLYLSPGKICLNGQQDSFDWWYQKGVDLNSAVPKIIFVGTLSTGFDFKPLANAASAIRTKGIDAQFVICGDGSASDEIIELFSGIDGVIFPGWISSDQYAMLASKAICSVAPYKNSLDFQLSIPNKIVDSFRFALPVVTSLNGVTKKLIEDNNCGYCCDDFCFDYLTAFETLILDPNVRDQMSRNAIALFKSEFVCEVTYDRFVSNLEERLVCDD